MAFVPFEWRLAESLPPSYRSPETGLTMAHNHTLIYVSVFIRRRRLFGQKLGDLASDRLQSADLASDRLQSADLASDRLQSADQLCPTAVS